MAFDFDERDPAMLEMPRLAVTGARRSKRRSGTCGETPANHPRTAAAFTGRGIDSIGVNPSSLIETFHVIADAEARGAIRRTA